MLFPRAGAGVDGRSDEYPEHRDDEREDEPDQNRRIRPVLEERPKPEHEREEERKPPPLGRRGKAKAEAGEEEQHVGDDPSHERFIPGREEVKSLACKAGQPGLEPGIAGFGDRCVIQFCYCPCNGDGIGGLAPETLHTVHA
jgi:hypothetical protein